GRLRHAAGGRGCDTAQAPRADALDVPRPCRRLRDARDDTGRAALDLGKRARRGGLDPLTGRGPCRLGVRGVRTTRTAVRGVLVLAGRAAVRVLAAGARCAVRAGTAAAACRRD